MLSSDWSALSGYFSTYVAVARYLGDFWCITRTGGGRYFPTDVIWVVLDAYNTKLYRITGRILASLVIFPLVPLNDYSLSAWTTTCSSRCESVADQQLLTQVYIKTVPNSIWKFRSLRGCRVNFGIIVGSTCSSNVISSPQCRHLPMQPLSGYSSNGATLSLEYLKMTEKEYNPEY